ncbi:hypothetical protein SCORR_v1c06330 [Spiroplasma corruscae]|uniref:Uncharacterized protein n=1 Tax=Spiroplasma corruscae TaxID=216934 RepID=A0A222EPF3_9MOLU|nr:hypothetical protein [Spiroplasma corruscae]ASP28405.1 hypothetical protein SCORR_v1c06330 [Spiroplasma corruscae]
MEKKSLSNESSNGSLNDNKSIKKYELMIKLCSTFLMILGLAMITYVSYYSNIIDDKIITSIWNGNFVYLYVIFIILGIVYFSQNVILFGFTTLKGKKMYSINQINYYIKATLFLTFLTFLTFINIFLFIKYLTLLNKVDNNQEKEDYQQVKKISKKQINIKPLIFIYTFLFIGYIIWFALTLNLDLINTGFITYNTYYFLLSLLAGFILLISYFICASLLINTNCFLTNNLVYKKWFIISAIPFVGAFVYIGFYIKKGGLKNQNI